MHNRVDYESKTNKFFENCTMWKLFHYFRREFEFEIKLFLVPIIFKINQKRYVETIASFFFISIFYLSFCLSQMN